MINAEIAQKRLHHQHITQPTHDQPGQVVYGMGAMQAQDEQQAMWSVALRTRAATQADIEQAITDRQIVKTWPMRGTIHFVAATDARWILERCAPRRLAGGAARLRQLELDERTLERCATLLHKMLEGEKVLSRAVILDGLARAGIDPQGQRGYHILWHLAQTGLICFGPRQGKEQTFVLLEEWIPGASRKPHDEALAELTRRYFTSHGPATIQDFAGWTGLTLTDARAGLDAIRSSPVSAKRDQTEYWWSDESPRPTGQPSAGAYLLPGFDEYLLGYKDRRDVLAAEHAHRIVPGGNGVFQPMIVLDGQVVGRWKRVIKKKGIEIILEPFFKISGLQERVLSEAERYCAFTGLPLLGFTIRAPA
jgi:hypothetical protein